MTKQHEKFCQVYADAVVASDQDLDERWPELAKKRELSWRGERQHIAFVAEQYACIQYGYNLFKSHFITKLAKAFPNIEATPARESSVAIYLHVPDEIKGQVEQFVNDNFNADEVDWKEDGSLRIWWD